MSTLLKEPATDWTDQTVGDRVLLSAQFLYVHGFISKAELERVRKRRQEKLEA